MARMIVQLALVAALLLAGSAHASLAGDDTEQQQQQQQCIPMASITALSLQPGMTQTRRRGPNVPTLNCVGNCPDSAFLAGAQCRQTGVSDNGLPSWKCDGVFQGGDARRQFRLGNVRVQCEGCRKAGDTDVVRGSCALTYSVQSRTMRRRGYASAHDNREAGLGDLLFLAVVFTAIAGCCYCAAQRRRQSSYTTYEGVAVGPDGKPIPGGAVHHHHHGGYGGGFGGGGFGTGMFTGLLLGDMMSRPHGGYGYGGGGGYDDGGYDGGFGGDSGWGDGGGFGGTDSV